MSSVRRTISSTLSFRQSLKQMGMLAAVVALIVCLVPEVSFARVFKVFGAEDLVRTSSAPTTEVHQFQVQRPDQSDFYLHVFYGGIRPDFNGIVPAATVTLNGRMVVGPSELNRNIYYLKKPVTLAEANTLSVELRGKPGSGVRVVITGKNDLPQVADFRQQIQPDGTVLLGLDLNYAWSVISQPEGGSALFSAPDAPSPSLTVHRPGEYSLLLKVSGASWEESFPVKLTATARPPFVPVPVSSRVVDGSGAPLGIKVGSTTYAAPAATNCGSSSTHGFQVVVVDRANWQTLADPVIANRTFNVPCGNQEMINFLTSLANTSQYPVAPLVIVSSLTSAPPTEVCGNSSSCPLGSALEGLGGTSIFRSNYNQTLSYTSGSSVTVNFSYSLIGIPGLGQSQGYELNDWDHKTLTADAKRISSNIEGYFIQDINGKWAFNYPESVQIETRTRVTTGNIIKVGSDSYFSAGLTQFETGGFQVVVLDRDTLKPAASLTIGTNQSFFTNSGSGTSSFSEQEQQRMYTYLNTLRQSDSSQKFVVIIASIGSVGPPIDYKSTVFPQLVNLIGGIYGGTTGVLNNLGAAAPSIVTYSLVGMNNSGNGNYPLGVASTVEESAPNQTLKVALHKDRQGWFTPDSRYSGVQNATTSPDLSLLSVALQAPTPWPLPNPADPLYTQQVAAYQYISNNVGEYANGDIRNLYYQNPITPDNWITYCLNLNYASITPPPAFSQDVFTAMQNQLCGTSGEFNYVSHVNTFLTDTDTVLQGMQIAAGSELETVYNTVKSTVKVDNESDKVKWDALYAIRGMLMIATAAAPNVASKAALGALNAAIALGMHFSKGPGGPDYTSVDTEFQYLKDDMNTLWKNCLAGKNIALEMVKSDWGKLQYVGQKLLTDQAAGGWKYDSTDKAAWTTIATDSLEAYYFQSFLPVVWKIDYKLDQTNTSYLPAPKTFIYVGPSPGDRNCKPYCGAPDNAYQVDAFSTSNSSWYVLEDQLYRDITTDCGYVKFGNSSTLRDVLFGTGDWTDGAGNAIGIKLGLSIPVFYERWLPSSVYRAPKDYYGNDACYMFGGTGCKYGSACN